VGIDSWLGTWDGPWEHEVKVDTRSWVRGPDGLAGSRLLLEAPGGVSLVDVSSATRVGPPIFGLDEEPIAALNDEGTLAAIATPADSSKDRAGTVLVLDAADGSELSRTPIDGHVTSLHFGRGEPRLLAGTADGMLTSIELGGDGQIDSELQISEEAVLAIDSRAAVGTMLLLGGAPPTLQIIGAPGAGAEATMEVGGLQDTVLQADGSVTSLDSARRIEILELGGEILEARSIDPAGIQTLTAQDYIALDDGRASINYSQRPTRIAIDLDTGARETPNLATRDGTRFPMANGPVLLDGGHAAISRRGEVALWRGGELVDRLAVDDSPTATWDGWSNVGTRFTVGVTSGEGILHLHLLDLAGDRIADLLTVEPTDGVFFAGPTKDDGMFILSPAGTVRAYGTDGALVDEYDLGFDPRVGSVTWAFDGHDRAAFARPSLGLGSAQVDILDRRAGGTRTFLTSGTVANLAFARGGEILVVQGEDGSIRLHDVGTGVTSPVIWDGSDAPYGVPWYDEMTDTIWVASADRLVQLPLGRDEWRAKACQRVGRDFTVDEWERLVPGDEPPIASCAEVV